MSDLRRADTDQLLGLRTGNVVIASLLNSTLYRVTVAATGNPAPYVYKEYNSDDDGMFRQHAMELTTYIRNHPEILKRVAGAPLMVVTRQNPDGFGVLLREVPGKSLKDCWPEVSALPLRNRLEMARDLAVAVAILHGNRIFHADLTENNIHYDPNSEGRPRLSLIDMDLSPIEDNDIAASKIVPGNLEYHAPEAFAELVDRPTIGTDRWALAVLLHHLLIKRLSPINTSSPKVSAEKYARFLVDHRSVHTWPAKPDPRNKTVLNRSLESYNQSLTYIDTELFSMFRAVFDQNTGANLPENRPTATAWTRAISRALDNLYVCTSSGCPSEGKAVVALSRRCPHCRKSVSQKA